MKKRLALAAAFAFSIIPFTSFADHLEPDESEIKKGGELVRTKLEEYDLFSNNLSDDILIAQYGEEFDIEPGADLSGENLSNINLSNADLSETTLLNADMSGADLTGIVANNLDSCPSSLPVGWVCGDNSLIELEEVEEEVVFEEEVEEVEEETAEAEDIDFDSITVESLPYIVDCPPKNKDLKIKQNKNEKFVVRFASGKKFYQGEDFDEAVDVFEETYKKRCVE